MVAPLPTATPVEADLAEALAHLEAGVALEGHLVGQLSRS